MTEPISLFDIIKIAVDEKYDNIIVTHWPDGAPGMSDGESQIRIDVNANTISKEPGSYEYNLTSLISIYPGANVIYWLAADADTFWHSRSFNPAEKNYVETLYNLIDAAIENRIKRVEARADGYKHVQ